MTDITISSFADMEAALSANKVIANNKRDEIVASYGSVETYRNSLVVEPAITEDEHNELKRIANRRNEIKAAIRSEFKGEDLKTINRHVRQVESKSRANFEASALPVENVKRIIEAKGGNVTYANIEELKQGQAEAREIKAAVAARINEFYKPYETSFPLADERESKKGFNDIITVRNFDADLQASHKDFREFMYTVKDPETGKAIGGINFIAYLPKPDDNGVRQPLEGKHAATVHMVYAFLDKEHRSMGLVKNLMEVQDKAVSAYVAAVDPALAAKSKSLLVFSEQNIPELMDPESYFTDSGFATKQEQRLMKWTQLGFRKLELEGKPYSGYVQPALSDDSEPCDVLSINAYERKLTSQGAKVDIGSIAPATRVGADTLKFHLTGFFESSVVGEAGSCDPNSKNADPTGAAMTTNLNKMRGQSIATNGDTMSADEIIAKLRREEAANDAVLKALTPEQVASGEMLQDLMAKVTAANTNVAGAKPQQTLGIK